MSATKLTLLLHSQPWPKEVEKMLREKIEHTVRICGECDSAQEIVRVGEDGLDFCAACKSVEGKTREISEQEWESMQ